MDEGPESPVFITEKLYLPRKVRYGMGYAIWKGKGMVPETAKRPKGQKATIAERQTNGGKTMTQDNGKTEITYIAGENPHADRGNEGWLSTAVKLNDKKEEKFEVYWPRPFGDDLASIESLEAFCQKHWETGLSTLIDAGIRQFMTRPTYRNPDADGDHKYAQEAADNYRPGRATSGGPTQKVKVQKYNALEEQASSLGMTVDELVAMAAKLKAEQS